MTACQPPLAGALAQLTLVGRHPLVGVVGADLAAQRARQRQLSHHLLGILHSVARGGGGSTATAWRHQRIDRTHERHPGVSPHNHLAGGSAKGAARKDGARCSLVQAAGKRAGTGQHHRGRGDSKPAAPARSRGRAGQARCIQKESEGQGGKQGRQCSGSHLELFAHSDLSASGGARGRQNCGGLEGSWSHGAAEDGLMKGWATSRLRRRASRRAPGGLLGIGAGDAGGGGAACAGAAAHRRDDVTKEGHPDELKDHRHRNLSRRVLRQATERRARLGLPCHAMPCYAYGAPSPCHCSSGAWRRAWRSLSADAGRASAPATSATDAAQAPARWKPPNAPALCLRSLQDRATKRARPRC